LPYLFWDMDIHLFKMGPPRYPETSFTSHELTRHCIQEELKPQLYRCELLKSVTVLVYPKK
jgi:hypothetical protein